MPGEEIPEPVTSKPPWLTIDDYLKPGEERAPKPITPEPSESAKIPSTEMKSSRKTRRVITVTIAAIVVVVLILLFSFGLL